MWASKPTMVKQLTHDPTRKPALAAGFRCSMDLWPFWALQLYLLLSPTLLLSPSLSQVWFTPSCCPQNLHPSLLPHTSRPQAPEMLSARLLCNSEHPWTPPSAPYLPIIPSGSKVFIQYYLQDLTQRWLIGFCDFWLRFDFKAVTESLDFNILWTLALNQSTYETD